MIFLKAYDMYLIKKLLDEKISESLTKLKNYNNWLSKSQKTIRFWSESAFLLYLSQFLEFFNSGNSSTHLDAMTVYSSRRFL